MDPARRGAQEARPGEVARARDTAPSATRAPLIPAAWGGRARDRRGAWIGTVRNRPAWRAPYLMAGLNVHRTFDARLYSESRAGGTMAQVMGMGLLTACALGSGSRRFATENPPSHGDGRALTRSGPCTAHRRTGSRFRCSRRGILPSLVEFRAVVEEER